MIGQLILWRHAEAVESGHGVYGEDLARKLTKKGERQATRMARWLDARLPQSTRIIVSPARRCQQTARALDRDFRTIDAIAPGAGPDELLLAAGWPDGEGAVLVVGHQPTLGLAVSLALVGRAEPWSVKKAGVWWLRRQAEGDGDGSDVTLVAVQSPDLL